MVSAMRQACLGILCSQCFGCIEFDYCGFVWPAQAYALNRVYSGAGSIPTYWGLCTYLSSARDALHLSSTLQAMCLESPRGTDIIAILKTPFGACPTRISLTVVLLKC